MRDRQRDPLIHCQLVILKSRLDSETTQISLPVKDFTFHGLPRRCLLVVENLPATAGEARDVGLIPGWGRSPGGGNGNPLQYSCLKNPMEREEAWWATVQNRKESDTTEATEAACKNFFEFHSLQFQLTSS